MPAKPMARTNRYLLGLLLLPLFWGSNYSDANAQACRAYAQEAVDQHTENLRLNCGFTGPRWNTNFRGHRGWCRNVNRSSSRAETRVRNEMLEQCRVAQAPQQRPQRATRCARYAQRAIDQQAENLQLACGLRGARWQSDFLRHQNWCRTVNAAVTKAESGARSIELERCRIAKQPPRPGRCQRYADAAMEQFEESGRLGCGFNNFRWNNDRRAHVDWCRSVSPASTRAESDRRAEMLEQCKVAVNRRRDCANYANLALSHMRANRELRCGFRGPRWNTTHEDHLSWCAASPRGVPRSETLAREAMLDECRVALRNRQRCPDGSRVVDGRCVAFRFSFPLPGGGVITIR